MVQTQSVQELVFQVRSLPVLDIGKVIEYKQIPYQGFLTINFRL